MGNLPFDATEQLVRDHIEGHASSSTTPAAPEADEGDDDDEAEGEAVEDGDGEAKKSGEDIEKIGVRGGEKSGLRKVRLGAFEDTGRCKGYVLFFSSGRGG